MTQKRLFEHPEPSPLKRARRVYAQFPLNLFRVGPSIATRDTSLAPSTISVVVRQESCASCSSQKIDSRNVRCAFCERHACSECELVCSKCAQVYCGLCAVKTYASVYGTEIQNSGKCFSCN